MRGRRGFTITEAIIAVALTTLVFSLLWNLWYTSRKSEDQLSTSFAAQQDLSLAVQRIAYELQEGVSIFFPKPDGVVQGGIAFVSATGDPIAFFVEPGADDKPGTLFRVDLVSKARRKIAERVNYFKASVEPPAPGKKACLANLNLSVLRGTEDVTGKADDFNIVRKVFLRNLKKAIPE